jgi:hypothetical protein
MFQLIDTFNKRTISKHRTVEAAVKADIKFSRAVKRANGANSYIPAMIVDSSGKNIADDPALVEQASRAAYAATYGR